MIHRMIDRCRRICGEADKNCYVNSKDQLKCITDVVINRTAGISMLLGFTLNEKEKASIDEGIRESLAMANELSNWVKYLQMISDLKELSSLVLDSDSAEKRKEVRYPLPNYLRDSIGVKIKLAGAAAPAVLVNFSQSGLQIKSAEPLAVGSRIECCLALPHPAENEVTFKATVRYSSGGGGFAGAQIEEVSGVKVFNFFNNVHYFIMETGMADR